MSAELKKLAEYYRDRDPARAKVYEALAAEERALGGPETVTSVSFSPEAREVLEERHFRIYVPLGVSVGALQSKGRRFCHVDPALRNLISGLNSEVAIRPGGLFLPDSFNKFPYEQVEIVQDFSRKLVSEIPGVQAVIADEPSVWGEIWHMHLEQTGDVLFGEREEFAWTLTTTGADFGFSCFGNARESGPRVDRWIPKERDRYVGVALLVVPA